MTKEKQIEEMARIMTKFDGRMCERLPNSCLLSRYTHAQIDCNFCKTAEDIYNAGYRKASDVAREIFEKLENVIVGNQYGEAKILVDEYLKIKKKYTEEGK